MDCSGWFGGAGLDGDMADYERQLLARPAIDGATGKRKKSKSIRSDAKPRSRGSDTVRI